MAEAAIDPGAPITHRRVLKIALPIVLSNATVPILGAVDTGVVGQLGEAAPIGAVGIGAIALSAIYWIFGFLRMGTTGLVSQALGGGNVAEASALLSRALLVAGIAGISLIALQSAVFWATFQLSPASPEVEGLAREYVGIRIWSAPAAIAIYGLTGWLIASERTRSVLVLQIWMNGLNVVLDLWFVLHLGWGVPGVALATFLSEWSALALGLWLCRSAFEGKDWRNPSRVFDKVRLIRMAAVNADILVRSVLLQIAFVSFLFFGATFGDVTLAANQILLQFLYITSYALDGFAFAAEALVGQAYGAQVLSRVRRSALLTSFWSGVSVLLLALVFGLFGDTIVGILTTSEDVRAEAQRYLFWMVLAPLLGVAAWMLDGIFIGATRTRDMRNMMIVSFGAYVASVSILVPLFGNHGLWASMILFFVARAVTLGLRYPTLERSIAAQP